MEGSWRGDQVTRVSNAMTAKYDYGVTAAETATQQFAWLTWMSTTTLSYALERVLGLTRLVRSVRAAYLKKNDSW